eukprot:1155077-Pelagomonas_calceolata.AAC.8
MNTGVEEVFKKRIAQQRAGHAGSDGLRCLHPSRLAHTGVSIENGAHKQVYLLIGCQQWPPCTGYQSRSAPAGD